MTLFKCQMYLARTASKLTSSETETAQQFSQFN